ncbi:hypothetical protein QJQ45_003022 [Haematococcus lacustris]|nr:hypothetical protein QJQ45_003022 [Haematococcus lacustris]
MVRTRIEYTITAEDEALARLHRLRPARREPTVAPTPEAVAAREAANAARLVSPRDAAIARLPAHVDPASAAGIELINFLEEQSWPEAHTEYPVYLHGRSVTEHEAMLEASLQRMIDRNAAAPPVDEEEDQEEGEVDEEEPDERDVTIDQFQSALRAREDTLTAVRAQLTALEASHGAVGAGVSRAGIPGLAAPALSPQPSRPPAMQYRNTVASLFGTGRLNARHASADAAVPQFAGLQEAGPQPAGGSTGPHTPAAGHAGNGSSAAQPVMHNDARTTAAAASAARVAFTAAPATVAQGAPASGRAPVGQSPSGPVSKPSASIAAIRQKYAGLVGGAAPLPHADVPRVPDTVLHSHRGLPHIERWTDNSLAQGKRVVTFLEDLEVHCATNNLDPALALPSFLSGKAREIWFKSIRDSYALTYSGYPTWHYLCKQFVEMVGEDLTTDLDHAHDKLMNLELLRTTSGVTLQEYITDFRNTITLCGTGCMNRALTVATFQRGLTPQLRGAVAKDLRSLPDPTLEDAVAAAIDNHKASIAAAGANAAPNKRGGGSHAAAVRPQISAVRASVTPFTPGRPGRAGGAGGAGTSRSHAAAASPPVPVVWCYHCGVTGHRSTECTDAHLSQEEAMRKNGNTGMYQALQAANEKLKSASGNKRPRPQPPAAHGGSAPGSSQPRNGPGGRGGRPGRGGSGRGGGRAPGPP